MIKRSEIYIKLKRRNRYLTSRSRKLCSTFRKHAEYIETSHDPSLRDGETGVLMSSVKAILLNRR